MRSVYGKTLTLIAIVGVAVSSSDRHGRRMKVGDLIDLNISHRSRRNAIPIAS